jgi:RimJ/RimL family protein N-acetyltransferase
MTRQIRTERLLLRELGPEDCSAEYVGWLNDPEVNRFLETRHERQDEARVRSFVETVRARDDAFLFGIFLAEGGRHIGNIKVGPIRAVHRLAEISLFIGDRSSWGRGYAAEAIGALSRYAFEQLGVEKLSASMYAPNVASTKAFLKVGYREEGRRRRHVMLDGDRVDMFELGLVPDDLAG